MGEMLLFLTHLYHSFTICFSLFVIFTAQFYRGYRWPKIFKGFINFMKCLSILFWSARISCSFSFDRWSNSIKCSSVNGFAWAMPAVLTFPCHQIYICCMWSQLVVDLYRMYDIVGHLKQRHRPSVWVI